MEKPKPDFKTNINFFWLIPTTIVNTLLLLQMCATAGFAGTVFSEYGYCLATFADFGMLLVTPALILVALIFSWKWYRKKMHLASFIVSVCPPIIVYLVFIAESQLLPLIHSCS